MRLRVLYLLVVALAKDESVQKNFIDPKSAEEIIKISPEPIQNENCKSKFGKGKKSFLKNGLNVFLSIFEQTLTAHFVKTDDAGTNRFLLLK